MIFEPASCESTITEFLNSSSQFVAALNKEAGPKFLTAFISAFLSTGGILGIIYVLIMRAIDADRRDVEAWLEKLRLRLQRGPVPIIEMAQPVMVGALYAVYGRSDLRRLTTSFFVGLIFTSTVFGVVYWRYKGASASIHEEKAQLEESVDPKLYSYATVPRLRSEYEKAWQTITVSADPYVAEYVYSGGIYDELRKHGSDFHLRLAQKLFASADRVELTPLFLLEGTCKNPGLQWVDSLLLFVFNVVLDFSSITIMTSSLRSLGRNAFFRTVIATFLYAVLGTLICAAAAFASYWLFLGGDTGFFKQLLALLAYLGGVYIGLPFYISFVVSTFKGEWKHYFPGSQVWAFFIALNVPVVLAVLGVVTVGLVLPYWLPIFSGLVAWRDVFVLPYVLAFTTLVPATLTLAAFCLMIAAKLTAEPARVMCEAYMTFFKEELGGRQAAGVILLVGIFGGVLVGLVWQ